MNDDLKQFSEQAAEEMAAFHEMHMRQLLKGASINPDEFLNDPKKLEATGYKLLHETNGDRHKLTVAKIIAQDEYVVKVRVTG